MVVVIVLDLVLWLNDGGGFSNVVIVVVELVEEGKLDFVEI